MKNKFLLISIPSLITLLLVGVLLFDYSEQKRSARNLITRANLLSEQLSRVNNIPPSRSFCESGEYRRLSNNYLNLSRDLNELAERWVSADKVMLQNIVSRIRGYTEDLSVKCARNQ